MAELFAGIFFFWLALMALILVVACWRQVLIFVSIFVGVPVALFLLITEPIFQNFAAWMLIACCVGVAIYGEIEKYRARVKKTRKQETLEYLD